MALQFLFPEGARLRRLASSLALPRMGTRHDMTMTTATHAYFLSFPWDGRPVKRRRALDMRTMSVGSWFEAVPWQGLSAVTTESGDAIPVFAAVGSPAPSTPNGTEQFFDEFFQS